MNKRDLNELEQLRTKFRDLELQHIALLSSSIIDKQLLRQMTVVADNLRRDLEWIKNYE